MLYGVTEHAGLAVTLWIPPGSKLLDRGYTDYLNIPLCPFR